MPREAEPSNSERAFILEALQQNIRLDGRALDAFRNIELTFGDEYGVADVQLGKTRHIEPSNRDLSRNLTKSRVLARISASITAPFPDRKFDGIFNVITELSPMASPAFEVGR